MVCADRSGFTLIELIAVLMIVALVMAIAAPNLRGFARGARLRDAAADFVASTQFARLNSATTAATHRILVEGGGMNWTMEIQEGEAFQRVEGPDAHPDQPLPEGYRVEITDLSGAPLEAIEFYPTGRTTPARVRITNPDGKYLDLEAVTPTDAFHITTPGGER